MGAAPGLRGKGPSGIACSNQSLFSLFWLHFPSFTGERERLFWDPILPDFHLLIHMEAVPSPFYPHSYGDKPLYLDSTGSIGEVRNVMTKERQKRTLSRMRIFSSFWGSSIVFFHLPRSRILTIEVPIYLFEYQSPASPFGWASEPFRSESVISFTHGVRTSLSSIKNWRTNREFPGPPCTSAFAPTTMKELESEVDAFFFRRQRFFWFSWHNSFSNC